MEIIGHHFLFASSLCLQAGIRIMPNHKETGKGGWADYTQSCNVLCESSLLCGSLASNTYTVVVVSTCFPPLGCENSEGE